MKAGQLAILAGKFLVSGGLLYLLYRKMPVHEIAAVFQGAEYRYLVPIFVLLLVNTVISAWKWQLFLEADGVRMPLTTLVTTYLIANIYNMFLPSNIGGDSYRIYDIRRRSGQGMRTAAAVFADRVSGFVAMITLGVLAAPFAALRFQEPLFFFGPLAIFLVMATVLTALFRQTPFQWFMRVTRLERIRILARLAEKFFLSLSVYGNNRSLLLRTMAISFVFQLTVFVVIYCMALALGARISFFYFCAFLPLIGLLEVLPVSINGIGLRDAGYVFFFGQAGMNDAQTRSLALVYLGVAALYSLVAGGMALVVRHVCRAPGAKGPDACQAESGQEDL